MDKVCTLQAYDCWSEKHALVVWMGSHKQNVVLLTLFISELMNINEDDREEVESEQHPLERHVSEIE